MALLHPNVKPTFKCEYFDTIWAFDSSLHGWPVGIWVIGNDVITACDQSLIDAGEEGIRLWRAKDSLEGRDADLSHALGAALQEERQQGAHNLGRIQLLCAKETSIVGLGIVAYLDLISYIYSTLLVLFWTILKKMVKWALTQWDHPRDEPKRAGCVSEKRPEAETDNSMSQGEQLGWHWCSSPME